MLGWQSLTHLPQFLLAAHPLQPRLLTIVRTPLRTEPSRSEPAVQCPVFFFSKDLYTALGSDAARVFDT